MRWELRERVTFARGPLAALVAWTGAAAALCLYLLRRDRAAVDLLTALHRTGYSPALNRLVERFLRGPEPARDRPAGRAARLRLVYASYAADLQSTPAIEPFYQEPARLLGSHVVVLKSPGDNERGVLVVDYTFSFRLFARFFDIEAIARRYHIVLEPSWTAYCSADLLCYAGLPCPVFVQSTEPRDTEFLRAIHANLVPVPVSGNWWVDHRMLQPLPGAKKDIDVIMVAGWAGYKRHGHFFDALRRLKTQGRTPKVLLIGYPAGKSRDDIWTQAHYCGVARQLELHEWLPPDKVNEQLNRARVQVLWSRKEGFNRALIEGFFAGVPCILRQGHNYGHLYPYINRQTGCFAGERDLPEKLAFMIDHADSFSPREWALSHMSCHQATQVLNDAVKQSAVSRGERWTRDIVTKTVTLHGMKYWDDDAAVAFEPDYRFIAAARRA